MVDPDPAISSLDTLGQPDERSPDHGQPGIANEDPQLLGARASATFVAKTAMPGGSSLTPFSQLIDVYATTQGCRSGYRCRLHPACAGRYRERRSAAKGATDGEWKGRWKTMNAAFSGLFFGLAEAIVLIYLLIVVNFHSWSDPFVIVMALPGGARRNCLDTIRDPHDTVSVPALTGSHHVHGCGDRQFDPGREFCAGTPRIALRRRRQGRHRGWRRHSFRPVLMTALAMIIGMAPHGAGAGRGRRTERAPWAALSSEA